ncbi:Uncharacterised protein [uncultured archaeon]|nr:Uncharacterised protein [uncultured archaeon]
MSDFLTRLVERTQGVAQVAQPIIPPMFSPASTTLSDYSQNSTRDSEPFNAPNRAIATIPDDLSPATLNQPFRKTSNARFAPPKHIESDHSEQVEAVSQQAINDQIEQGIVEHSSNLTNPEDLTNSKRRKENSFGNNELPTNKTISEYDQNTSLQPEQSLDAKKDVSGRFIDSDKVNVQRNLPESEWDQNTGTQLKHLLNEKRDESGVLIKSERVRGLQEIVESERDQNISPQPEHSLNEKRVASEGLIDSHQAPALRDIEVKHNQNISLQPEQSLFDKKQEAYVEPNYSNKTSVLRKITESTEVQHTETSFLKPLGQVRFQQAAESEPPSAEPTIKVTIGRVEVRAIMPSAPIAPASRSRTRSPTLSLNDYLKQRNEGQR